MGALTDLWKSERGLLAVLIIVAASVFVIVNRMTITDWQSFVTWIFGLYAGGKTVTGAMEIMKGTKVAPRAAPDATAPAPAPVPVAAP